MYWLYQGIKVASPTIPFVPLGQAYDLRLTLVVPSTDDDAGKVYLCLTDKDYMGQIYAKKNAEWAYKELMPFPYASCLIGTLTSGQRVDIDFRIILEDGSQAAQFNIPVAVCSGDDVIEAMPSGVWCGSDSHEPGLWGEDHESRPLWLGGTDQCPFHEDGSICVSKDFHWLDSGETLYYGDVIYIKPADRAMYKASSDAETAEGAYAIGLVADGSADLVERFDSAAWADEENYLIFDHGGEVDGTIVNTLSIYDPTTRTWSTGTAGGGARKEHSAVVYGRKAYVYGGIDDDGNYLNSLYSYNLDAGIWTSLGTGGTARAGATIEIIDGNIYIVGGYDNDGGITTVDIYDTDTGTYTTGAELSDPDEGGSPEPEVIDPGGDCYTIDAGGYTNATIKESTSELWLWVPPDGDTSSHWVVVDLDTGEARYFYGSGSPAGYNIGRWCWDGDEIYNHYSSGGTDYLSKFDTSDEGNTWQNVGSLPCSSPCNRWQVNYEGYRYDIAEGTKTNISTGSSSEWVGPPGLEDAGYMVIGAKDGYIYVADAEEWNPSPGVTQIRLILWLHNLDEGTWAKITFDSPWDDYDNWADRAYHIGAADSDYLYIVSGSKALTGGDYSEENCVKLFRIRMVSGEAATAYVLATESKIYRINPSTRKTQSYDTSTDTWTTVSTANAPLPSGGTVSMFGNNLYLVGGEDAFGNSNDQTYILNPTSGVVDLSSANISSPHIGGNSVSLGGAVYAWGGHGSGYQATMDVADLSSNAWEAWDLTKRKVQTQGFFTNESWDLTPGAELYLSTSGNIQEGRPSSGHIVKIGKVISAQTICLDPRYIEYIEPAPG